eukprot:TRINITY_DN32688_c0_g1_i1.p1 TRINITY_DN32688_c0_g1~~TRINITY_DN32688_c0_g1_i1.p1  ORF type:complete len:300 (+),score=76.82 TRINITY_DN32688_c0_g1_i1:359-1258(+)
MARLFKANEQVSAYRDRRFKGSQEEYLTALLTTTTVYVGNLSFYTTEEQIYEVFSRTGEVKKILMGLDKNTMTPCGFCFVQYYTRDDTEDSVKYISGTVLDDRPIRVDFDWGFEEGRQWGRGRSGGQVRDEYRTDYDPGRGGYGKLVQTELELQRFGEMLVPEVAFVPPFVPMIPPPQPVAPHRRFNAHPRRAERGGGGGADGGFRQRESGRKRGRDEAPVEESLLGDAADPHAPRVDDAGEPPRAADAGGAERQEPAAEAMATEDAREEAPRQGRNPRFRERGDHSSDDDEEERKRGT